MFKTTKHNKPNTEYMAVSTERLAELLDCGKVTAKKIGEQANAKIQIGRRVLWNTKKINDYLDNLSNV